MRDIDIKKKIEIFLSDTKMIVGIIFLIVGFMMYNSIENPMSYKPLLVNITGTSGDGKITNMTQREDGYFNITVEFKDEEGNPIRRVTESTKMWEMGQIIDVKTSVFNKNWYVIKEDKWDATILMPISIIIVSVLILIPITKKKWLEVRLFTYGQVVNANLTSKEQADKNRYRLEYEIVRITKEKAKIIRYVEDKNKIEKVVKVLYMEEDINKNMILTKEYGVDLYRI